MTASASFVLPTHRTRRIYDVAEVDRVMEDIGEAGKTDEMLKRTYKRMRSYGGERFVAGLPCPAALDALYVECPNFAPVITDIKKYVKLMAEGTSVAPVMPLLLLGDPGVGKTHFAKRLARILGTHFEFVSLATLSAGWILSGTASTWAGARAGKVAGAFIDNMYANPVVVLDELDKAARDTRYDPLGALYQLMEPETSAHFKDEYLDIEFDCSLVTWVGTANDLTSIPDPILGRMAVYDVKAPTRDDARDMAQRIYAGLLDGMGLTHRFEPALGDDVLDVVGNVAPRDMRKKLVDALGSACVADRRDLKPTDFGFVSAAKRSMGF